MLPCVAIAFIMKLCWPICFNLFPLFLAASFFWTCVKVWSVRGLWLASKGRAPNSLPQLPGKRINLTAYWHDQTNIIKPTIQQSGNFLCQQNQWNCRQITNAANVIAVRQHWPGARLRTANVNGVLGGAGGGGGFSLANKWNVLLPGNRQTNMAAMIIGRHF